MCCTRSACTGDSAVAGVVTSSFFVASFVGHRPIFWGNYFSSSVLYLTTTVCKQRAANCEGPNAEKHRLQFTLESSSLEWLCRETTPKGACEGHDHLPRSGHLYQEEAVSYRKITLSVVSCPPRWVNTLKAINQRARLFSAAVMLRPSMFCVFMVAGGLLFCTACCYLRKSCAHGVLGAVAKRPTIHTTCMLCYRKERLSSLYSEMHPTHPAFAPAHVLNCVPVSD